MRGLALAALAAVAACNQAPADAPEQPPIPRFEQVTDIPAEHGERLSHVLGCVGCHTPELTGEDWTEPEMGVLWTANLTQSAATYSHDELAEMITLGKRSDRALWDMPSFLFNGLHPEDVSAVIAYLKTLEPVGAVHPDPTVGPQLQKEIARGEWVDSAQDVLRKHDVGPPDLGEAFAYGRFILRATCVECHGMDLRGEEAPIAGAPARPDLRMVGSYSREEFAHFIETGEAAGGRELVLMSAVARRRYARFTDAEEDAVYDYLNELARKDP